MYINLLNESHSMDLNVQGLTYFLPKSMPLCPRLTVPREFQR